MGFKITAVAKPASGLVSAAEIPDSFKKDFEEIYEFLRTHPGTEGLVTFEDDGDDVPEADRLTADANRKNWIRWAPTYASTREAGALKYRQLPSKMLKNQVRFQITADLPENGAREGNN